MKQIIKKLLHNIKFLISWQHTFFYLFLFFIVVYFFIFSYTPNLKTLNYNNIIISLGKSILLSISVSSVSISIGILLISLYLTKSFKSIKVILDNVFIFPEIVYIFMLLLLLSPITNIKFIIILSSIRAYSFFNVLILEIDEIENKEFINALFLMGLKRYQIIRKHILPILTIPIGIFFLETIIWFMVIEFALSFINVIKIYQYPSIGTMLHHFIQNEHYKESYLIIILLYLFIFELNYITTNIKIKFEILFRKEN